MKAKSDYLSRALASLLAVVVSPAFAGVPDDQDPHGQRDARVDALFAEWDKPDSPGCALGVYRDGEIIYVRGYGMADLERGMRITPQSVFDIGSTSKQFAAASVVLLAHQGKLSLDDDVRKFIPELPVYDRPITVRQLLLHTSGLRDYIGLMLLAGDRYDDVTTPQDALAMISRQKALNFEPGAEHLYSNSGYFLLSIIVERVAGQSLRDVAHAQIFAPLGMTRTHYLGSYDDIVPGRAIAYSPRPGGGLRSDMPRWLQLGDGAVFTTVEELLLWDRNFYEPKVGGQALPADLQTPGHLENGAALTYALGLIVGDYLGQRTVSHGGAWGGYRAELIRFPDQRFSVATLCNLGTINPSKLARKVAEIHLADVLTPEVEPHAVTEGVPAAAVSLPEAALRALSGSYRDPLTRIVRTIEIEAEHLVMVMSQRFQMRPLSDRTFEVQGAPIRATVSFDADIDAAPSRLRFEEVGKEPIILGRIERVELTASELSAYEGIFRSDELQAHHALVAKDGELTLTIQGITVSLRPSIRDEFSAGHVALRFIRNADGEITGFLLGLGRIRNLGFERMDPA
jgi:CubicO group peptidase (beta-lactamase class C family)